MLYFNIELSPCGTVVAFNGNRDGITAFVQQLNWLDCSETSQLTVYPEVLRAWSSLMLKEREPGWSPRPVPYFGVFNGYKRNTLFEKVWLERVEQPERFLAVRVEDKTLWIQVNNAGLTELKELLLHCRDQQYWFLVPRATSLPHVLRAPIGASSVLVNALEFICPVPSEKPWLHIQDGFLCKGHGIYDGVIKGNALGLEFFLSFLQSCSPEKENIFENHWLDPSLIIEDLVTEDWSVKRIGPALYSKVCVHFQADESPNGILSLQGSGDGLHIDVDRRGFQEFVEAVQGLVYTSGGMKFPLQKIDGIRRFGELSREERRSQIFAKWSWRIRGGYQHTENDLFFAERLRGQATWWTAEPKEIIYEFPQDCALKKWVVL